MSTIEEKRVYGDRAGATDAYVASGVGVVRVSISGDVLGEFGLVHRCRARDVAASGDRVAVATDDEVVVLETNSDDPDAAGTGFGPAVAVGFDGDTLVAAAPDGRIARRSDDEWLEVDPAPDDRPAGATDVRAIDGDLVATADGVARVEDGALTDAGLADARDVAAGPVPLAATGDGLYRLGNGWMREREGPFDVVASTDDGDLSHAVSGLAVYEYAGGEWREFAETSVPVADVGYGETLYAVTERGTFLAAGDDGWRPRALGVGDVTGLVVPGRQKH